MDAELAQIIDEHDRVKQDASDIRNYLLWVLENNKNDVEKFSDEALEKASELIEQVGPGAFY